MKKTYFLSLALFSLSATAIAQRQHMDCLDRGLVAIKTTKGIYCSWRIQADEYYDVQYNLYRDGTKVNAEPLSVSNLVDAQGSTSDTYTVRAVVNGKELSDSKVANVWSQNYLEIVPRHDPSLTSTYIPNDACCADVDGDGVLEILLKYDNKEEGEQLYPKAGPTIDGKANGEYALFECLKLDGTVLWWVNCGPNMGDFQNNEQNIVGYDWDGDGKSEVVMRLEEGSCIHMADGTTYTIGANGKNGSSWTNYRIPKGEGSVEWFTYYGKEFLVYCEGLTGKPYQCIDFPLKRLEDGESDLKSAWGDGYGHRSSKFFFGAPYLDGQHPSIFLGRGIYTRHKFVALDVNPETHELTERWRWMNNTNGPWKGQGYHNYSIADVDWDGRDEIVWGSMVIDDNGLGLSTTGLGHGDAHHVGDLNPYMHGQEGFFCNEDQPANNFRDLTTSRIYYRMTDTSDAGRALAGNFYNTFPGATGNGAHDTPISTVTNKHIDVNTSGLGMNFRIYWDEDLLEECFDGNTISKPGYGNLTSLSGAYSNNGSKATPCYQGDLLGDWREEVIERTAANNIRIFTTTTATTWRNYSLWYDHQYRNAMVWQMCGYNQPPHVSYFLGELEGITLAPPPLTTQGREIVANGATITSALHDRHVLVNEYADATVTVEAGAQPAIVTLNVPSWVQGSARSESTSSSPKITYTYYSLEVQGAAFSGRTRLVKQGDGRLILPAVEQTYTGPTDIWAGVLDFDGKMKQSRVWLNRFAELNSAGTFQTLQADYASIIRPGGAAKVGTLTADSLILNFGSRVVFDLQSLTQYDNIVTRVLNVEYKDWKNGPEYNAPVFEFNVSEIEPGTYPLLQVTQVIGDLSKITLEGLSGKKATLVQEENVINLVISGMRDAETCYWTGEQDAYWNLNSGKNFSSSDQTFVSGDTVIIADGSKSTTIRIAEEVAPGALIFQNKSDVISVTGNGTISGTGAVSKYGAANTYLRNVNTYTGGTYIYEGSLSPGSLANKDGEAYGSFGGVSNPIYLANKAALRVTQSLTSSHPIKLGEGGGSINVTSGTLIVNGSIGKSVTKSNLYKEGSGTLQFNCAPTFDTLYINGGTVYDYQDAHFSGKTIVFNGGTLTYSNSYGGNSSDNSKWVVPEGKTGVVYPDGRCDYTGALTGGGTLDVHATFVRLYFKGNWSQFTGTINAYQYKSGSYDPSFDFLNSYGIGKATLNITDGTTVHTNGQSFAVGALTGTGTIDNAGSSSNGTNLLSIGGKGTDFTFNGKIVGSNVAKVGTGTWTITKTTVLAEAGTINVREGRLKLNLASATTSLTGSKTVTVRDGAEVLGRGVVQTLTLESGSILRPGINSTQTSNTGIILALGNINIKEGANLYVNKNQTDDYNSKGVIQYAGIECNGTLTLDGTIHVTCNANWKPAAGDSLIVAKARVIAGSPTFVLQELPENLKWDTSTVATDGVLRVISANGISNVRINEPTTVSIYNLSGKLIATFDGITTDEVPDQLKAQGFAPSVYLIRTHTGIRKITLQ